MASLSNSRQDDNSNVALDVELRHSINDIPSAITTIRQPGRLQRAPAQVRANKEHLYTPALVRLGLYHRDAVRFDQVEQLKNKVLNIMLRDKNDQDLARYEFLNRAQEIRNFYGVGEAEDELAEMMLRCILHNWEGCLHIQRRLGLSGFLFMVSDLYMLENQVPLWAIKLLIRLALFKGGGDDGRVEVFIWKFVCGAFHHEFWDPFSVGGVHPWRDGDAQEPLHLIQLYRASLIKPLRISNGTNGSTDGFFRKILKYMKSKINWDDGTGSIFHPNRSMMELKAKGIQVRRSSTCLIDIKFESYWFFGELLLPSFNVSNISKVFFSNLIAFEMSPETKTNDEFISYVNFMQSLIESPEDVKELREKGVLLSSLNDEQVMNTFKELNIYGWDGFIFEEVKRKIDWHCRSKAKTWMVELSYTYFRNPWSAIALCSAAILLFLTFLQTFYAKKSVK